MKPSTKPEVEEDKELVTEQQGQPEMAETPYEQTTACDHYLVWESEDIAVCRNGCGHGCMLNPADYDLKDGKIVNRKRNIE